LRQQGREAMQSLDGWFREFVYEGGCCSMALNEYNKRFTLKRLAPEYFVYGGADDAGTNWPPSSKTII
jgi:hypothetical protein